MGRSIMRMTRLITYKDSMPAIVREEMERFEQLKKEDGADSLAAVAEPPSKEVIDALRQHFLSGEADFFHGGFIDCMESIGAVSSVSDPLVYGIEYNSWDMGNFDEIEHEARVRLLRYRGKPGDDWFLSKDEVVEYVGVGSEQYDETLVLQKEKI